MPQLSSGGGDDMGANDEMIAFKDEGEQEEKISEDVSAERDLDDVKSSLVNESENNSSSSDSEVSIIIRPVGSIKCALNAVCVRVCVCSTQSLTPVCTRRVCAHVSKQRGARRLDPTRIFTRRRGITSAKVNPTSHGCVCSRSVCCCCVVSYSDQS